MINIATIRDIAKIAGVSPALVSLALNGKQVSEDSSKRIFEAAEKLHYHPKKSARSLATGKMYSVGLYLLNKAESQLYTEEYQYFYSLIHGVSKELTQAGYSMQFEVLLIDGSEGDRLVKKALEQSIDGMIVIPQWTEASLSFLNELERKQFPVVLINPTMTRHHTYSVSIDNYLGGKLAFRYLYENGHRNIGVIAGPENHIDNIRRIEGFVIECRNHRIIIKDHMFKYSDYSIEGGYKTANEILSFGEKPTAIFCADDYIAAGAIRALLQKGIRVPEEVSILGFDDIDVAAACYPQITTLKQPLSKQGQLSAKSLLSLINQKEMLEKHLVLEPVLVERESVYKR